MGRCFGNVGKRIPDWREQNAILRGNRHRVALVRALYKDFEHLINDEATIVLDMEVEKAVIDLHARSRKMG